MKNSIKTNVAFATFMLVLILPTSIVAQEFQGRIYYVSKSKVSTDFGQRQVSEVQKARIKERQEKSSTRNHILEINNSSSLFSEKLSANPNIQQTQGRNGGGFLRFQNDQGSGTFYKNITTMNYVVQKDMYGKQFLIKDKLTDLNWQKSDEVKTIGKYLCFKATATIPKNNKEEETTITAWYTIEIPISSGPELYWGLPGLILELQTPDIIYLCSKLELSLKDSITIDAPKKGKKISQKEYDKILAKKIKEIKELRNNRRSGGNKRQN